MSRRAMLFGTGAAAMGGGLLGFGGARLSESSPVEASSTVEPRGPMQAGIARPQTPHTHALIVVADVDERGIWDALAALGDRLLELIHDKHPTVLPDGAGDLSISIGVGQRILNASSQRDTLAGFLDMPTYRGDDLLPESALGGDLLLSIHSSNPVDLEPVYHFLQDSVTGFSERWSQFGFRGPGEQGIARNPFGYHDGVTVPRTEEELADNVWIPSGPLEGGSICVLRSFLLDISGFRALSTAEQDQVFGREKLTGIPMGGTDMHEDVNVSAKTPTGDFVIPSNSHIRAAHPSFTGSKLMLRRSYSFIGAPAPTGAPEQGLLFISFQNEIKTFILTQQRMDEIDSLMDFSTPIATGAFAMLPGFDEATPLGSSLR